MDAATVVLPGPKVAEHGGEAGNVATFVAKFSAANAALATAQDRLLSVRAT
jgi:hypothetical protein